MSNNGPVHILLVEDELNIARGLMFNLEEEGYRVTHVEDGQSALDRLASNSWALVILDLSLPGMDGLEVVRAIREADQRLPVLILTARTGEADRLKGLSMGADDYMTKPFSLDEFLLRVQGMLRRSRWYRPEPVEGEIYRFGSNHIDLEEGKAWTAEGEMKLTDLEVRMLRIFFEQEGKVLSRPELLQRVWGVSPETETRTLDNFIVRLRRYFEPDPSHPIHFLTVRGRGYRFHSQGTEEGS